MSAGSWTEFGASFLIRTCAHGSGGRRLDQANLEPSMLAGAVADGADRRYAGVRVPGAGASLGGDQAAAAARPAPVLAVHDRSCAWGFPSGGLHPVGADHRPERELSRAWSAGLPRCFGRAEAPCARVVRVRRERGRRILEPLTAPVEG